MPYEPSLYTAKPEVEHVEAQPGSKEPVDAEGQDYAPADVQLQVDALQDPANAGAIKKYMRKLDWIILPTITMLYFLEYLDRGNVANAKLYGLDSGHDTAKNGVGPGLTPLSATDWQVEIMIFYVGLVLFQIPGCLGYRVFPPSKWIAFGVCFWAIASLLQCAASNLAGLAVCRVFIGVGEGLFGTGILYYLSLWYMRGEMGIRVFWFLGPTALAGAFGGLIAYGVGNISSSTPQWRLLFIIEGVPTFCLGLFCLYWLPDRPMQNSSFSGKDQEIAEARYKSEDYDRADKIERRHFVWVFTDWKLYAQVAVYLPTAALLSSISGFLPTIISGLGYSTATQANLMTVPPYACSFVLMYSVSWFSDRYRQRGLPIAILMVIAGICYALLATLPQTNLNGEYGCVCVAVACVYATYPPSHAWAVNNFGNETKRAIGAGAYTAMGNLGSIAGSWIYPSTDGPLFIKGHLICMALAFATALFSVLNSLLLRAANRHRDRVHGKPVPGQTIDITELADRSPHYRFIL